MQYIVHFVQKEIKLFYCFLLEGLKKRVSEKPYINFPFLSVLFCFQAKGLKKRVANITVYW